MKCIEGRKNSKYQVPGFDLFAEMFNVCDMFNRKLHDRTWPHKFGGKNVVGGPGKLDDFAFSAAISNAISVFKKFNNTNEIKNWDYQTCCIQLSNELYSKSLHL